MDSKFRSHSGAWGLTAQAFEKRAAHNSPHTETSLILISLLSLGLCATIWGTVASLAAVLR